MITFKQKSPRILYLHGKDEEIKYPGGGIIYSTLKSRGLSIDFGELSSEPDKGKKDFMNLPLKEYDLILGFSMGAVYASCQDRVPMILINPGYGLSKVWPEFKWVDLRSRDIDSGLVRVILVGTQDKYQVGYLPEIKSRGLIEKVVYFPGKHVPTEEEIVKYIIPVVYDNI